MSLFGGLFTAVSGLNAQSSEIGAIANNIANVNTVGYKNISTSFSSLVTGSGVSTAAYSSGGVLSNTKSSVSQQGTLEQTGNATDLAISGNGFFVVKSSPSSPFSYTRAGSFNQDNQGNLVNSAGLTLYGWPLTNGQIPAANSDLNSLQPVNIAFLGGQTKPTTTATLALNVNSTTATGGTFSRSVTVYDSLGSAQTLNLTFTKTAATNTWTLGVTDGAGNNLLPLNTVHTPNDNTVDVLFNTDGSMKQIGTTAGVTTLSVAGTAGTGIVWGNGSSAQTISLNGAAITQFAASNNVTSLTQDGAALGLRTGVTIDNNGVVAATFSNGTFAQIYKLPLATFSNPNGLSEVSGNAYSVTTASGDYNLRQTGSSGAGSIAASSLEQSTVDLGTEFSNMIVTQRAYSANTKIISTVDQMLQGLLAIVQ